VSRSKPVQAQPRGDARRLQVLLVIVEEPKSRSTNSANLPPILRRAEDVEVKLVVLQAPSAKVRSTLMSRIFDEIWFAIFGSAGSGVPSARWPRAARSIC